MPIAAAKPNAISDRLGRDERAPLGEVADRFGAGDAERDAGDAADQRERDRLDQELQQDVRAARAPTAMRRPISRVRSVTDTSMMFMMPMPPTSNETDAIAASR